MTTSGAQNRLIGGRRASRRANMELFSKVISQAFLLCTRIDIFEKNVFWSQVKSWFVSMFSFETAQSITFWATFWIFDDFSIILDWSASWFQKISFENIIFAIHATTFNRFGPCFSRWFEAWGPPRFTFEILSAKKIRKRNRFARELQISWKVAVFDENLSVTLWFYYEIRTFLNPRLYCVPNWSELEENCGIIL